jgi:hypothetical protein
VVPKGLLSFPVFSLFPFTSFEKKKERKKKKGFFGRSIKKKKKNLENW